jgi:TnpA family transposase
LNCAGACSSGSTRAGPEERADPAVFFNRVGELRDRSFENQPYRASGLNLMVDAIVLWNTMFLGRAVQALRAQ